MSDEPPEAGRDGGELAEEPIRAAGGVVWRETANGGLEVLLIHRPKYDDWGLPKGKAEARDADARATALREVWEETGLRGRLGADLGEIGYTVRGHPKVVRYWAMQVDGGQFTPNREVDEIAWLSPDEARARLAHDLDVEVLDRLLAARAAGQA